MLRRLVRRFIADQSGATAIEYGMIAALVAVGAITAITAFGNSLTGLFGVVEGKAGSAIDAAAGTAG